MLPELVLLLSLLPRVDVPVAAYPTAIAVADFDRDGRDDLVTLHGDTGEIWILRSRANETPAVTGPLRAGAGPVAVEAADLNGDRRPDLIVANSIGNSVTILRNLSDGTF